MQEDAVHLLARQNRFKEKYKNSHMLPKVNKADMAGMMEAIKEYIKSHHGVMRAPLAYIIRKTITVQIYGDTLRMQLLMMRRSPGCYNYPQTRTDCKMSKVHIQSRSIQITD